jgi:hypothetical protein
MLGAGGNNYLFAVGGDDLVENSDLTATTAGSAWSVHAGLLVPYLFPSPAVGSSADGRLEVLAVSEGGRLLHQWQLAVAGNLVGLVLPRRWARWEPLRIPGGRYRCRRPARGVRGGFQPDAVPQVADRAERRLVRLVLPRPSLTDEGEEPPGARASGDSSKAVQPNELQGHARACHRNGRASLVACRSAGVSSATRRAMVSRSWIASTTRRAMASVVCR